MDRKEIFTFVYDFIVAGSETTVLRTELFVSGRLEKNFTRASEFIPDRWLRSNGSRAGEAPQNWTLHPFASLPFSSGVRMCIGRRIAEMELCVLIAKGSLPYRLSCGLNSFSGSRKELHESSEFIPDRCSL
ncbi:hypothetical protein HPB50_014643 [Hyalomma asiaticum]|uniref:Uncharacterized protein n=1 Tax=Hyalomma asiaticum TaxID=266040 RepID=A0ACB7RP93_HYAAI|nr:hypothetical protein HPB50_014643 [Hyalomma asiaticum]